MTRIFIFLFISLISTGLFASQLKCYEDLLTNGHGGTEARHYFFESSELDQMNAQSNFGNDFMAKSIASIRFLLEDLNCTPNSVNFGKGPEGRSHSSCKLIRENVESSRVCYVETNLGYFLVSWDYLEGTHFIFNRYD
jgi:hypothetical protein